MEIVMLDYLKRIRGRMRSTREINCLDERVLEDLGISRSGLRNLSSTPQAVMRRFTAMSTRQCVDDGALSDDLQHLSGLVSRCQSCSKTRACEKFLVEPAAAAEQATFCPNFAEFRRLSDQA